MPTGSPQNAASSYCRCWNILGISATCLPSKGLQQTTIVTATFALPQNATRGTAGLITIEDLIEEIVGEIQDEYDVEEAMIEEVSDHEALFDARVSIRDVNDTLDLDIEDEDFDTLGGLLYHELGKVPSVGDEVRIDGALVTVLTTTGRRVRKVRVMKVPTTTGSTEGTPQR